MKGEIKSCPTTMLVNLGSVATMINTKHIEQVINNLIKENDSLKGQLDKSKHENKMQNEKKKFELTSQMTHDQLSRPHETIMCHKWTSLKKQVRRCITQLLI